MPIRNTHPTLHPPVRRRTGGFTLTELLVVVAIIVVLIGTLVVSVTAGAKRAQIANTQTLMGTISNGLATFQNDFGYLPPVLGQRAGTSPPERAVGRDVINFSTHAAGGSVVAKQQGWRSYTTLAEYLIGYGNRGEDGYGIVAGAPNGAGNRESPPFGIRSPGPDGAFGSIDAPVTGSPAALGLYQSRNPMRAPMTPPVAAGSAAWNQGSVNGTAVEGKVYGPYIELKDERLIAGITGFLPNGRPLLRFADEGLAGFDNLPKVIVDYWGEPIAYYRTPYADNDLRSTVNDANGVPANLGDVFALRRWELDTNDQSVGAPDAAGDDSSGTQLKSAAFALLSMGPDRAFDRTRRRDLGEFNKDNIVVTGK